MMIRKQIPHERIRAAAGEKLDLIILDNYEKR